MIEGVVYTLLYVLDILFNKELCFSICKGNCVHVTLIIMVNKCINF
jgi:hypothetical protein